MIYSLRDDSFSFRARCTVLGNVTGTGIFEDVRVCAEATELKRIKILRYEESIYYANVENFKYKIIKLSGVESNKCMDDKVLAKRTSSVFSIVSCFLF